MDDTYDCYWVYISIYDNMKEYRDLKWKFYYKHNFHFSVKWEDIWTISDLFSTDLTFEKLKPQIKKMLWEHFWFLWRVRNLFR